MKKKGYTNFFLHVATTNKPAINLYKKFGFYAEKFVRDYYYNDEYPNRDAYLFKLEKGNKNYEKSLNDNNYDKHNKNNVDVGINIKTLNDKNHSEHKLYHNHNNYHNRYFYNHYHYNNHYHNKYNNKYDNNEYNNNEYNNNEYDNNEYNNNEYNHYHNHHHNHYHNYDNNNYGNYNYNNYGYYNYNNYKDGYWARYNRWNQ